MVAVPHRVVPRRELSWHDGPTEPPEILSGAIDPIWLWHSLRRKWLLAIGIGLAVGLLAALAAWLFMPQCRVEQRRLEQ
jgi:hypothetical protein